MSQGARTRSRFNVCGGVSVSTDRQYRLPADVIAPVPPPPVTTSGTALGRVRSLLVRFLAGMRG